VLYPNNIEEKIDFVAIRQKLKNYCISALGEDEVDAMVFHTQFDDIQLLLDKTHEMQQLLSAETDAFPTENFFDVRAALARVRVEGLFMDETEIFDLRRTLEAVRSIVSFIANKESALYPNLSALTKNVGDFQPVVKRIDLILSKFGKVRDNASVELARIRKECFSVQSGISRALNAILRQAQTEGFVAQDVSPTVREGRLVIPVSPAFKRKISGIVHDESATGKTVFIEPQQVVEANNRIRELEGEERREIIKILSDFTDFVRPYTPEIVDSQRFLGEIDFLHAKALFAQETAAIRPKLDNMCQIEWERAMHPLLFLSLKKQKREMIPLDIQLSENQRVLIISGPNAGGKSVCLKTVVLLQYMLQCGLLVSMHQNSRCGVFERIFIDIGDEQSIENDLSTYSSHLLNMKFFIKNSNKKTLLLIDEFGTGTEPQIGGAIAEAVLESLNKNRIFGLITTHYTNLKHFAEDTEGIVNGAMLYDRQHLQPLFRLEIGHAGSSFAVEIARKIGLPQELIDNAAQKVGNEHLDYDKHLQDIARDKRYWEKKREQIRLKEKKLAETLAKYETELSETNRKRKEIVQKAKQDAQILVNEANAQIENTIREIKESSAEKEKTQEARKKLQNFSKVQILGDDFEGKSLEIKRNKDEYQLKPIKKKVEKPEIPSIAIGDNVHLKNQEVIGKVIDIQENKAVVAFGNLKSVAKLSDLERISHNQQRQSTKYQQLGSRTTDAVRELKLVFKSDIDLRGMRVDEALQAVTYFIDDALVAGTHSVSILHGTGTGALRQSIRQYLATIPQVARFYDERVQLGGAGITIVEME
ncbi:MAG: Smr/MutS family protein, partial [Prevotellaceae bacterium]|jgi:DNA mismatch repair protein MutS2|nr:Smr/MutS family protein [Prevotellaceae bacterium]